MRIVIIGTSGSGKTTLAKHLSAALVLPRIELDAINWQAGWKDLQTHDPEAFKRRAAEAAAAERWVCDGNYSIVRPYVWPRATHFVWLDYARPTIMRRVIWRSFHRAIDGTELWPGTGNRERFSAWVEPGHPIRWAWSTHGKNRKNYEALFARPEYAQARIVRLRHPGAAANILHLLTPQES